MFRFSSSRTDDIIIERPGKIARHGKKYIVENDNQIIGTVVVGDKFGFIDVEDYSIRIDRKRKLFEAKIYFIKNRKTGILIGTLEFLDSWGECILSITNGSSYFFHRNSYSKNILKPKTWFSFEHNLTDSTHTISFLGKTPLNSLPLGIIESTNDRLILPIFMGIFIIEENMRTLQENSG